MGVARQLSVIFFDMQSSSISGGMSRRDPFDGPSSFNCLIESLPGGAAGFRNLDSVTIRPSS